MDLSEIVEHYSSKMTQIHLYQRAMKEIAKKELENLYKYELSLEKNPEMKKFAHSFHGVDHGFGHRDSGERCVLATEEHGISQKTMNYNDFRALPCSSVAHSSA